MYKCRFKWKAIVPQRPFVALDALCQCRDALRAVHHANAAVTFADHLADDLIGRLLVVAHNSIPDTVVCASVKEHDRIVFWQTVQIAVVARRRKHKHAVDLLVVENIHLLLFPLQILVRTAQHELITVFNEDLLDCVENIHGEERGNGRYEQSDPLRAVASETAGVDAGNIPELLRRFPYPLRRFRGNKAGRVEHM